MIDRRAKVTRLPNGAYRIEGVAYVADEPNINGITYPKEVLVKALSVFLKKDFRPVLLGCGTTLRLVGAIGEVTGGRFEGNVLHMTIQTFSTGQAARDMEVLKHGVALAGTGMSNGMDETNTVSEFEIISIGLVPVSYVTPEEKP